MEQLGHKPIYRSRCIDCSWKLEDLESVTAARDSALEHQKERRAAELAPTRNHYLYISFRLEDVIIDMLR